VTVTGADVAAPTAERDAPRPGWGPGAVAAVVVVVGCLLSGVIAWGAWSSNERNERDLLDVQTKQAAAVLGSAILGLREPLERVCPRFG